MNRRNFIRGCVFSALAGSVLLSQATKDNPLFSCSDEDPILGYFEVHVADHCNLNCKNCCHFSSISDKHFYDLAQFNSDMARLSEFTKGRVNDIRIMGGEPLLNPDINKYFDITRKYFKKSRIRVITNAILLDRMDEDFWKNLSKNAVVIEVTLYKVNIDWKSILSKASKYGIEIIHYGKLVETFHNINLDLKGSMTNFMRCRECFCGGCYNLLDGKLYVCPIAAYVKYFNKAFNQNIKISDGDYIDLYKAKNVSELWDWMKRPKPFCKYCGEPFDVPWETSNKHSIDEWTSIT